MELPVFKVKGFQTIEEYTHALEIRRQVIKRLKAEERNMQLWGGKYCGRLRRRRRRVTQNIGKKECCVQDGRCTFDE